MDTQSYWFYLYPYVYVEFMDKEILLYNTKENGHLKIINNSLISLIKEMYYPENLGVTKVNKDMLENLDISSIITTLIQMKMAELKKIENDKTRPIVLIPILNFQNDIDKIKEKVKDDKERSILLGKNTLKNLFELNIYINRFCTINCAFCKSYFKQFECCTGNPDETEELSINVFKNIINQIKYSSVNKINILGGNIFKYSELEELNKIVSPISNKVHLYLHYKNYKKDLILSHYKLDLIVDFPVNESILEKFFSEMEFTNLRIHFIIKNEEEYDMTQYYIKKFQLLYFEFHPFYTTHNLDFFEKNIFLEEEDIFVNTQKMREIFRNKKLNKNFFGKLYIKSNGDVSANINKESLGNIKNETILNLVNKELIDNTAWRLVRDKYSCCFCLNKFICPPISNIEIALNKYDLCHYFDGISHSH